MCHPCKAGHHHDEGSSISAQNPRTMGWFGMMVGIYLAFYLYLFIIFLLYIRSRCMYSHQRFHNIKYIEFMV